MSYSLPRFSPMAKLQQARFPPLLRFAVLVFATLLSVADDISVDAAPLNLSKGGAGSGKKASTKTSSSTAGTWGKALFCLLGAGGPNCADAAFGNSKPPVTVQSNYGPNGDQTRIDIQLQRRKVPVSCRCCRWSRSSRPPI